LATGRVGVYTAADLDLAEITRGKYDFDVAGHFARQDVFRLHVNESLAPAVVFEPAAECPGPRPDPTAGGDGVS
jgi:hypothetical protein